MDVGVDAVVVSGDVATVAEVETMMTMGVAYGKDDFVVAAAAAAVVGWVLSVAEERATQQDEAWFVCEVE